MDHLNASNRTRQQRFYDNLRWYLKNQLLLQGRGEAGDADACQLVAAFRSAATTLAESKIDLFNEVAEHYRASNPAMDTESAKDNLRDTART